MSKLLIPTPYFLMTLCFGSCCKISDEISSVPIIDLSAGLKKFIKFWPSSVVPMSLKIILEYFTFKAFTKPLFFEKEREATATVSNRFISRS